VVKNFAVFNIFFMVSHEQYIKNGKVLDHLGFMSKVLPGPLTDLSAWVGFCTSSPQQGLSQLKARKIPLIDTPSGQELCRP
jgi:hypothetical protein